MKKKILLFTIAISIAAISFAQYPKRVHITDNSQAAKTA